MDVKNLAYFYDLNILDFALIDKALTLYLEQSSYLNKDNVEKTLQKGKKIIGGN